MKRFQEGSAMGFRCHGHELVMGPRQHGVVAGGEVVQGRVFDNEVTLPHGAPDVHD